MTNVIKKAKLYRNSAASRYTPGIICVELKIISNGKDCFAVSAEHSAGESFYYITTDPALDYLIKKENIPENIILESHMVGGGYGYEHELSMRGSEYYKVYLYMRKLKDRTVFPKGRKMFIFSDDNGKDIDGMILAPLAKEAIQQRIFNDNDVFDNPGYLVTSLCLDELNAPEPGYCYEAIVYDINNYLFLEVIWNSGTPGTVIFEKNTQSIHSLLIDPEGKNADLLKKIRETGKIYSGFSSAMHSKYRKLFDYILVNLAERIEEKQFFETKTDGTAIPGWYKDRRIEKVYNLEKYIQEMKQYKTEDSESNDDWDLPF